MSRKESSHVPLDQWILPGEFSWCRVCGEHLVQYWGVGDLVCFACRPCGMNLLTARQIALSIHLAANSMRTAIATQRKLYGIPRLFWLTRAM